MKIVSPFKPFKAESPSHKRIEEFDWLNAIAMLRYSAWETNRLLVHVLTDRQSVIEKPVLHYETNQNRLMLWILEVTLCYLHSEEFDDDTMFISPDFLIFGNVNQWWGDYDAGFLWRGLNPRHLGVRGKELLNSVQFWRVGAKERLIKFYEYVYELAKGLPENEIVWGADTIGIEMSLHPMQQGLIERSGIRAMMIPIGNVVEYATRPPELVGSWRPTRLLDFKYLRKLEMARYFEAMFTEPDTGGWMFPDGDRFMKNEFHRQGLTYQQEHLKRALSLCKRFRTAIDGGAHVGTWSVPMSRRFDRVIAFEAAPDTFGALKKNVRKFGGGNVKMYNRALGDRPRRVKATLEGDQRHIETGNFGARHIEDGNEVDLVTIDSMNIEDLDFLKLDIEGSEFFAMNGGRATIKRCKPIVLFEDKKLWMRYGLERKAPHNLLSELGMVPLERVRMDEIWGWQSDLK